MDESRHSSKIRFGKFEADLHSGELRKQGHRIRIQPQPMRVLAVLLESAGALVTREELRKRLWPDDLYVDFEHGLNRSINKLRRALLDDASSPVYIETLSTRGYRFIASVEADPSPGDLQAVPPALDSVEPSKISRAHWNSGLILTASILVLVALIFTSGLRPGRTSAGTSAVSHQFKPAPLVTFANGSQWLPAFSPDGSRIAYTWVTANGWYLEVKDVGADTRIRLTPRPAGSPTGPAWSPDGRQIAYTRTGASDDRGIFIISAIGGPERKLHSLALWRVPQRLVSWSPDGRWIAFADEIPDEKAATPGGLRQNAIYLISPETSEIRQLTQPPPGDYGDAAPTFSPDGATIAFIRTKADSHDEIYTIPVQGGPPRRLVTTGLWTNGLTWSADSKSIVFDRSLIGGFRLWKVSAEGGEPRPLEISSKGENLLEPALWRDRLAYEAHELMLTTGRISLNGSRSDSPSTPVASTRIEHGGRYSPIGERIAFISDRTGDDELWMAESDGTNPVQLTHLKTPLVCLSWHPSGNSIAVSTISGKVFLVPLESRVARLLFDGLPFTDENAPNIAFSRDGSFLYVLSQPGTGKSYELLKVSVTGGTPVKVMNGLLTNFAETADGTTLFYSRDDKLWQRSLDGGPERFVAPTSGLWDLRADGIYLLTDSSSIERYSYAGKRLQTLARLGRFDVTFPMSVSANGQWALFGYKQRQTVEIDMVQGFN